MATLKLVIVPAKRLADGSHKVRIAISHKGDTRYIVTRYIVADEKNFKNGRVTGPDASIINRKLSALLNDYYDKLDTIETEYYTCAQIKEILENKHINITLISQAFDEYVKELTERGSLTSIKLFNQTKKNWLEFGDIVINTINNSAIRSFSNFLNGKYNTTTRNMHLKRTKTVLNYMIDIGAVSYPIHPYKNFTMPPCNVRHTDLPIESIRMIRDAEIKSVSMSRSRDIFMLSYYLGGMNAADMVCIDFSNLSEISFQRKKTANKKIGDRTTSFTIPDEAKEIILKYRGDDGYLKFFNSKNQAHLVACEALKMKKYFGIKNLMFYSARKSFAQHAFDLGVSIEVIEYIIGHTVKTNRPVYSYVRVMRKHADEAIRKVLDYLNGDIDIAI